MRIFFTDSLGNPKFGFRRSRDASSASRATAPTVSPVRTTLFFYVLNRNWEWVLRRCRTHPHEILQLDSRTGDAPLHAAVRLNPPAQVVRALLLTPTTPSVRRRFSFSSSKTSVSAASPRGEDSQQPKLMENMHGWTALHVAASNHCSQEVLQALCEHAPQAVAQVTHKTKRTPIHCAAVSFRGLDRDAFFYLLNVTLQYDMSAAFEDELVGDGGMRTSNNLMCLKDGTGQTPLALLFRRYRERVKIVCQRMDQLRLTREQGLELVHSELGTLWEKARGMVERLSAVLTPEHQLQLAAEEHPPRAATIREEEEDGNDTATSLESRLSPLLSPRRRGNRRSSSGPLQQPRLASFLKSRSRLSRRFRLVHASVGLIGFGCPPEMIRLAVSLYPHQVGELDEDGMLPVHIAAQAYADYQQAAASAMAAAAAEDDGESGALLDDHNSLHSRASSNPNSNWETLSAFSETTSVTGASTQAGFSSRKSPWDQVFDMLLQHHPQGARTPARQEKDGLPLVLAMRHSSCLFSWRRDGLERLMHAYPPALHLVLDGSISNGQPLYPHLLSLLLTPDHENRALMRSRRQFYLPRSIRLDASAPRRRTPLDLARTSAVYRLLQTKPEMVERKTLQ